VAREAWTDERLDDFAAAMRPLPGQVAKLEAEVGQLRDEMRFGLDRLSHETLGLRQDLSAFQRQLAQIGWTLSGALVAAMIALIVAVA
jgi:hypothetical protein